MFGSQKVLVTIQEKENREFLRRKEKVKTIKK